MKLSGLSRSGLEALTIARKMGFQAVHGLGRKLYGLKTILR